MTFSSHWDKKHPKCGEFLFSKHAFTHSAWLVIGLLGSALKQWWFPTAIRMSLSTKLYLKNSWSHSIYHELSGQVQHSFLIDDIVHRTLSLENSPLCYHLFFSPRCKRLTAAAFIQCTFCVCFSFSFLGSGFPVDLCLGIRLMLLKIYRS